MSRQWQNRQTCSGAAPEMAPGVCTAFFRQDNMKMRRLCVSPVAANFDLALSP